MEIQNTYIQSNTWDFYGRNEELENVKSILSRGRWFFLKITGRRRIGKTTLVQKAIQQVEHSKTFYMQVPDADAAGVVLAANRYFELFLLDQKVKSLAELASVLMGLVREGFVVSIDEFQYFNRKPLFSFCSFLQAEIDLISQEKNNQMGGLIVLGSIQSEMNALLDNRLAPLYNRVTDEMLINHLDLASVKVLMDNHGGFEPYRMLFLWNLFEGVPKFYRDAFEQGVLGADREALLEALFFRSSSPLKSEAENWFLHDLKGKYDTLLQYLAKNPGANYGDLSAAGSSTSDDVKQLGGYLAHLEKKLGMIVKKQPIFGKSTARTSRYYLADNFLKSWLFALKHPVQAQNFRVKEDLIKQANEALETIEGHSLELMTAQLFQELSRKGVKGYDLQYQVQGYWDRMNREIDLIALMKNEIWFVSCKRNPEKQFSVMPELFANATFFMENHKQFQELNRVYVFISPLFNLEQRTKIHNMGGKAISISELVQEL